MRSGLWLPVYHIRCTYFCIETVHARFFKQLLCCCAYMQAVQVSWEIWTVCFAYWVWSAGRASARRQHDDMHIFAVMTCMHVLQLKLDTSCVSFASFELPASVVFRNGCRSHPAVPIHPWGGEGGRGPCEECPRLSPLAGVQRFRLQQHTPPVNGGH